MQASARSERMHAVAAHPLTELLSCPAETEKLLTEQAQSLNFESGETVFRQDGPSQGLYLVVSGEFIRRADRQQARLTLGPARAGDLVELAAALGDGRHTYTLRALIGGRMLLLPIEALRRAFESFPPMRMRLLEELAREVSRAYLSCTMGRTIQVRRRGEPAAAEQG